MSDKSKQRDEYLKDLRKTIDLVWSMMVHNGMDRKEAHTRLHKSIWLATESKGEKHG